MQTDSCLNSEQLDTLSISVGGHEGNWGGGSFRGGGPNFTRDCQEIVVFLRLLLALSQTQSTALIRICQKCLPQSSPG
jgi:hypothetical protein